MPLLDCDALVKQSKMSKTKLLAEAFVKHAIPMIDASKLQESFLEQIKTTSKPELVIFSYKTTEITVDGSTIAEDSLTGQKVSTVCYEFCDKLPCGTPIGKAVTGFAACELLGMLLGPNIHVNQRFKSRDEDHPQWLGYTSEIVAHFQEKPVKRSSTSLAWWPEDVLKQLLPQQAQAQPQAQQPQQAEECKDIAERMIQAGILYTTHSLVANEAARLRDLTALGPPPPLERVGATADSYDAYLDERPDEKCTYCGEMDSVCGGDHGDDMRYEQKLYDRRGQY